MLRVLVRCSRVVFGTTFGIEEAKVTVTHLKPDKGVEGYDLLRYYDEDSLRDEKWRFDPKTGSTVVSRRSGFREMDNIHLVDATLDALGSFTKSYLMKNEKDLIKDRVKEPQMSKRADGVMADKVKSSSTFSGVSFNTQYSSQNGYPHVSNVVGIQHLNAPNLYNGLNFQQAFATPGFGFQQQGSLFNHQSHFQANQPHFPNNNNFQIASFLMPFLNQHNQNFNQVVGSFSSQSVETTTSAPSPQSPTVAEMQQFTSTSNGTTDTSNQSAPSAQSEIPEPPSSTQEPSIVNVETTEDPTLNFDIRLEKDKTETTNQTETQNIQTTTRRTIEGLPTSDEDYDEEGILDDKISSTVLKTLVG
ncbi:hypothetical protein Bhyg_10040 [Pseudolycoriella hygida]|uniref:Uncharacterized protein n=1 Tax=Pseudolycoriella hygida TaxID=35572 RepID=A0A9Q0MUG7_9DIPT|nr:hypothetical protein Bhyg_10040 [Pseudolycoriella hygida]